MQQSPYWEANGYSGSQEILRNLWNQKVHYRVHISLPPVTVLSHIIPVQASHPTS